LYKTAKNNRILLPSQPGPPNPLCYVCGHNYIHLHVNTNTFTFKQFLHEVVKKELFIPDPDVQLGDFILWEADATAVDDDDDDDQYKQNFLGNLDKTLSQLGIVNNSIVLVEDFNLRDLKLQLAIVHQVDFKDAEKLFEIRGAVQSNSLSSLQSDSSAATTRTATTTTATTTTATTTTATTTIATTTTETTSTTASTPKNGGTSQTTAIELLDDDFDVVITSGKASSKRSLDEPSDPTRSFKRRRETTKDGDGDIVLS